MPPGGTRINVNRNGEGLATVLVIETEHGQMQLGVERRWFGDRHRIAGLIELPSKRPLVKVHRDANEHIHAMEFVG